MVMKTPPQNDEFRNFTNAMRKIVQVPKKVVQAKMDAVKQERASDRASRHKG